MSRIQPKIIQHTVNPSKSDYVMMIHMLELPESDYKAAIITISHGVKVNIFEIKRKGEVFRSKIETLKIN